MNKNKIVMDNWKEAINGSEIDTDYFLDSLLNEIISGKEKDEIVSGIEKEYSEIMKPYNEALKQWEENLKYLESKSDDEIRREYDELIARRMKAYDETLSENEKTMKNSSIFFKRISDVNVNEDFKDVVFAIENKVRPLMCRNEFIEGKRRNLAEGRLDYDETYDYFKQSKFNGINSRIRKLKKGISDYERIREDKIRFINKVFDELKL